MPNHCPNTNTQWNSVPLFQKHALTMNFTHIVFIRLIRHCKPFNNPVGIANLVRVTHIYCKAVSCGTHSVKPVLNTTQDRFLGNLCPNSYWLLLGSNRGNETFGGNLCSNQNEMTTCNSLNIHGQSKIGEMSSIITYYIRDII